METKFNLSRGITYVSYDEAPLVQHKSQKCEKCQVLILISGEIESNDKESIREIRKNVEGALERMENYESLEIKNFLDCTTKCVIIVYGPGVISEDILDDSRRIIRIISETIPIPIIQERFLSAEEHLWGTLRESFGSEFGIVGEVR